MCLINEWIKKINTYTLAIKKNEILTYATLIDHVGIMLSGISQMEKDKSCSISVTFGV